jgi:hypothetical protein
MPIINNLAVFKSAANESNQFGTGCELPVIKAIAAASLG